MCTIYAIKHFCALYLKFQIQYFFHHTLYPYFYSDHVGKTKLAFNLFIFLKKRHYLHFCTTQIEESI